MALPKPEKRIKEPKPLTRKTALKPYKVDGEGKPIIKPKAVKPPKKRAKTPLDRLWIKTRTEWFDMYPPDLDDEYYQCALCPYPVHVSEVSLDHKIPRSRRPDLRYDFSNLQPCHWICNSQKGSRV